MKNELIKIVICLILLTSIKAKSQLIDESIVTSYDPANNFYEFKKETVTKATDLFAAIDRRKAGGINLRLFKSSVDQKGLKHDKYFQYYNNILIEGTEFIVHNDNEQRPQSANGKLYDNLSINTVPAISETQAISNAIRYSGAKQFRWEVPSYENRLKEDSHNQSASYYPNATLVIKNCASPGKPDDFRLCFKIRIYSTIPTDTYDLYADAQSGKIVSKNQIATTSCFHSNNDGKKEDNDKPEIAAEETSKVSLAPVDEQGCAQPCVQGTANLDYYGSQYIYTDKFLYALVNCTHRTKNTCTSTFLYVTKNNGNDYRDNTNNWTTGSDKPGTTSLWCLERTHDFYRYTYGRNSFNGASAQVNLYAESDAGNAYWTGSDLKIGTAGGSFTDDLTTLDIIGHEFTHGVTQYEAALIYQGESGALNESFSDIFGKMVDYYTKSNYSTGRPFTYILAEECTNGGLRSMSNPNSKNQPDTYGGSYWVSPSSSADNGGVHTNSGVQNYWFYLLAEGGSGTNDLGNTFCVAPIGKDKAASIAYRTLSVYLTSSSNYANARFFSIQSAIDLYGAGSNEVAQVTAAWYAVGIGSNYSGNINITNHTATGIENYKFNAAVSVSNFTAQSGSRVTITSSRAIEMTGVVKGQSGCMFHAYIAPGCVGGAIVAESGDNAIRNGNKEQTTGTASGNIEGATVEDAILIQNPNDGNFKIVVNTGTKNGRVKDITIQDIFGNIVWKEATSKTVYDVDIASKASGLYIVRFSDDAGKITTKKFIKQ